MNQPVTINAGEAAQRFVASDFDQLWRMAGALSKTGMIPYAFQGKPEDTAAAIMMGQDVGLSPMQALQNIAVINGRPALWGEAIPALLQGNGFHLEESFEGPVDPIGWEDVEVKTTFDGVQKCRVAVFSDELTAVCTIVRPCGKRYTQRYSVIRAKVAGLWDRNPSRAKKKKNGNETYIVLNDAPWYRHPLRMLQMRARGLASRDGAADVLKGLYVAEELQEMKDITPDPEPETAAPDDIMAALSAPVDEEPRAEVAEITVPDAYASGRLAQRQGKGRGTNPFDDGALAEAWDSGWAAEAEEEDHDERDPDTPDMFEEDAA